MFERRSFLKVGALAAGSLIVSKQSATAEDAKPAFALPALDYGFDALEPNIDAKTMEIHHSKHHAGYITKLNEALIPHPNLAGKNINALISDLKSISDEALMNTVRNNGGGHWNHSLFWKSLAPSGKTGKASDNLTAAINAAFGSMEKMKEEFGKAAGSRFGSGWAWLIVQDGKLKITSTPNQDAPIMKGVVPDAELGSPLLGLDVWEHAYYLHYQNRRPDYVTAFWNIVNWDTVSKRLEA
jgi:superoxide dismutase, Fe-Mn family